MEYGGVNIKKSVPSHTRVYSFACDKEKKKHLRKKHHGKIPQMHLQGQRAVSLAGRFPAGHQFVHVAGADVAQTGMSAQSSLARRLQTDAEEV